MSRKYTYVKNQTSMTIYFSCKNKPNEWVVFPGNTSRHFNHPDEWMKFSIDKKGGGGRVVSDELVVGNDRSTVIVDGQGPDIIEIWRVKYGTLSQKETLLGYLYYA